MNDMTSEVAKMNAKKQSQRDPANGLHGASNIAYNFSAVDWVSGSRSMQRKSECRVARKLVRTRRALHTDN